MLFNFDVFLSKGCLKKKKKEKRKVLLLCFYPPQCCAQILLEHYFLDSSVVVLSCNAVTVQSYEELIMINWSRKDFPRELNKM